MIIQTFKIKQQLMVIKKHTGKPVTIVRAASLLLMKYTKTPLIIQTPKQNQQPMVKRMHMIKVVIIVHVASLLLTNHTRTLIILMPKQKQKHIRKAVIIVHVASLLRMNHTRIRLVIPTRKIKQQHMEKMPLIAPTENPMLMTQKKIHTVKSILKKMNRIKTNRQVRLYQLSVDYCLIHFQQFNIRNLIDFH
jgi:hypothetical protein